jgi:16S rRNA (cytosine967-C5)-methyltransferase
VATLFATLGAHFSVLAPGFGRREWYMFIPYTGGRMKLAPARLAAFGALLAVDRGAWSAEALDAKSAHLDTRDAGLASDIVFGTLRRRGEIDGLINLLSTRPVDRLDPAVRIAIEMALYQMRFLDRIPGHAAVNDSVELARRAGKSSAAAFVNAVLRRSLREAAEVPESLSTPAWLMERWTAQYGAGTAQAIARASLEPPGRYIRVGNQTPPAGAQPTHVPGCWRLDSGDPGPFRFQDIGSQAVVPLLDLHPGQSFLDLCAAPGNKTAQALESGVSAIACDIQLSRARTLGALGIPVITLDATHPLPFARRFDRILVDAPCSGTGTLARNPEIKWRLNPADLIDLQCRQIAILRSALAQLMPGGLLVYSTCSLEKEENQDVLAASGATVLETMQRIPGRDPGDGFFAALLRLEASI